MRLLLIGAPGSGKGTQAQRLAERFGIAHISSGDLLRQNVKDETSIGLTIKQYVDAGFDEVYISQMGPDQEGGIKFLADDVLPLLRG